MDQLPKLLSSARTFPGVGRLDRKGVGSRWAWLWPSALGVDVCSSPSGTLAWSVKVSRLGVGWG